MIGLVLFVVASAQVVTEPTDRAGRAFDAEIARWKVQIEAADRDMALTDSVLKSFMAQAESAGPKTTVAAANATLKPLKSRYPDFRLNYAEADDYCPVVRAISSAKRAASARKVAALNQQLTVMAVQNAYLIYTIDSSASKITGKPYTAEAFGDALIERMNEDVGQDEVRTDWGPMDYIKSNTWAWDDCD